MEWDGHNTGEANQCMHGREFQRPCPAEAEIERLRRPGCGAPGHVGNSGDDGTQWCETCRALAAEASELDLTRSFVNARCERDEARAEVSRLSELEQHTCQLLQQRVCQLLHERDEARAEVSRLQDVLRVAKFGLLHYMRSAASSAFGSGHGVVLDNWKRNDATLAAIKSALGESEGESAEGKPE